MIKEFGSVKWKLTKSIPEPKRKVEFKISTKYPDYSKWEKFSPQERKSMISYAFQRGYKKLVKYLDRFHYKTMGTKSRPTGIELTTSLLEYKKLKKQLKDFEFFIQKIQGAKRIYKRKGKEYVCVKALFQVQIEGLKKGTQTFEERFMLIEATSHQSAEKKLLRAFRVYEKPYLNYKGEFVRWKFESFDGSNSVVDLEDPSALNGRDGVEVFSKLGTRRLTKNNIWKARH